MAQNTRPWNELIGLASARCGFAPNNNSNEIERLGFLANSAARQLYFENPWWERFLVLEPRTVTRGYVDYSEDSYNIFGAGTSDVNGLYVRDNTPTTEGKPSYKLHDDGDSVRYLWADSGAWYISTELDAIGSDGVIYVNESTSDTPPENGWSTTSVDLDATGESPAPIVQKLSEIGEYIGHWAGAKWSGANPKMGTAYPDQNGIRITESNSDGIVYMAFKKSFDTTYGDGTGGTVSDVPSEWFEFMAYSAARSLLQTNRNQDSFQAIAISEVERVREQALLKINRQGIYKTIAQRFRTYYNQDVSVY